MSRLGSNGVPGWGLVGSHLPPGVRDVECDGFADPLSEAGEDDLWRRCGPREQERLSSRFAESHLIFLRDAVLDAEDSVSARGRDGALGAALWAAWLCFRDRALRELRRCGEFGRI